MEAALPTELDAELNTLGEYNFGGALSSPMTAHPKIDPITGEMHFFGYLPFAPYLRYHVISPNGEMTTSMDIELERAVMMHDFVITRDHVVFFDLPALFDIETMMSGGTGIRWDAAQGARIGVLPRGASADAISWTEIEPCYVFHFLNGWDEDGKVVVDACRSEAMPISFGDDAPPDPSIQPTLHRYVIDPATATATVTQIDDRPGDFPRVNDEYAGLKNRYGYLGELDSRNRETLLINAVTQWDFTTDTSTTYNYGDTKACGEAVFAPDPAGTAENDGWLLNFVTDTDALTSELVILDARDLAAGPVAQVHIPRRVPFGFHGNWMPA
jgi:carotenoid cleavage dioxygenase